MSVKNRPVRVHNITLGRRGRDSRVSPGRNHCGGDYGASSKGCNYLRSSGRSKEIRPSSKVLLLGTDSSIARSAHDGTEDLRSQPVSRSGMPPESTKEAWPRREVQQERVEIAVRERRARQS